MYSHAILAFLSKRRIVIWKNLPVLLQLFSMLLFEIWSRWYVLADVLDRHIVRLVDEAERGRCALVCTMY